MASLSVGLLIFPKVQQLDLTGPYEVFATLPDTEVSLVWKTTGPTESVTGMVIEANQTFDTAPAFDVLCVPGGPGVNALMEDEEVLAFIRAQAAAVKYITSVCTGSLVLGAAGLLKGRRATTHWASHHLLSRLGAEPVEARVVRDGPIWTGGGVTAGIDMALGVVEALRGREAAETVQLYLEYAPEPPFASGHPSEAPDAIVATARETVRPSVDAREAIVARLEARAAV